MSGQPPTTRVTSSGIPLQAVYTEADLGASDPADGLGAPGEYPFTRGIQPTMYRGRLWTMRQYAGFASAEESNRRYRYLLQQGGTGLSVAFDLPTQMGYDSDRLEARGEVGRVGVAINSLDDAERLFAGIPLERVSTSMTINATAPILLALYLAVARRQGAEWRRLSGTVQNDILKEYIARGTYIYPLGPALRLVTDIVEFATRELPEWNTISISGYHIREAGCTAAQELAFTLANGFVYVQSALERGLEVDAFAPRLSFFFNAHQNFLEEVAKFRAARRMWARHLRERFGARQPRSLHLRFHAQTAGSTLTARQPLLNIVRTAYEALAAVLGGTQSLHTNAYDEALGLPSEEAARIALRTQQILAHETGVADVVDPLGGAYCLEALANQLEAAAESILSRIDAMGGAQPGMLQAIESGYVQREIQTAAYAAQRALEERRQLVVGVNAFDDAAPAPAPSFQIDPSIEAEQIARLRELRARRDSGAAEAAIARLTAEAAGRENLMPAILNAVESLCTLGEISDALRACFGEYREVV